MGRWAGAKGDLREDGRLGSAGPPRCTDWGSWWDVVLLCLAVALGRVPVLLLVSSRLL